MAAQQSSSSQSTVPTPAKSTPRDALVMAAILKEMGISEYEPRVINQMLEFTYREYINFATIMKSKTRIELT